MMCPDCSGSGHYFTAIRISGEMVDADYAERACETCDGLGEVDHVCPGDRMCPDCWADFDRRLDSLKQDHSAYVEKIGQALLRVESQGGGGQLNKRAASPGEEGR